MQRDLVLEAINWCCTARVKVLIDRVSSPSLENSSPCRTGTLAYEI